MSELKKKIADGENVSQDFKFRIDDQRKIARTLVAFANTHGGVLLIGVKDNGKITGVNPEEEYYMIEGAADLYTQPQVQFESTVWQEGHYLVLEIDVKCSDEKHRALDEDGKWKQYVRVDDHTLLGNKILSKVWQYEKKGINRPEEFDENTLAFLKLVKDLSPVSLSKLYRSSNLKMKKVDQILSVLVFWKIIRMQISESGTLYSIEES